MAMTRRDALIFGAGALASSTAGAVQAASARRKVELFGHRGASALRPEHTLASYAKAIADGADFIEPDLVATKDGVLVIRHENNIAGTTDVASHPEFADRKTQKTIDGQVETGWFTEDFTLAELKTLRAVERLPQVRPANAAMNGWFDIVTWPEMVDFAFAESLARGRPIGLIPEIKHSTYFRSIGLPMEDRFLDILARHAYLRRCPLVIQSFEVGNLRYLRSKLGQRDNLRLMQLVEGDQPESKPADIAAAGGSLSYRQMMQPAGLKAVAAYADILAPNMRSIIPLTADGHLGTPTGLVADAHAAGLAVMPWTFRPENYFIARDFWVGEDPTTFNATGSQREIAAYLAAGIDGFFTDDPAIGRSAIDA